MTRKRMTETYLPAFSGFYCTNWEDLLSRTEELYAAMEAEERSGSGLEVDEFAAILSDLSDAGRFCASLARAFCSGFGGELSKNIGFKLDLEFAALKSPAEYNFRTDRILAKLSVADARKLFRLSEADKHERLEGTIRDWFTPYRGFASYYSADLADWLKKPIDGWDRNELCVLLDVFTGPDIDGDLFDDIAEGDACGAFEDSVDWKRFERMVAARRKETAEYNRGEEEERA